MKKLACQFILSLTILVPLSCFAEKILVETLDGKCFLMEKEKSIEELAKDVAALTEDTESATTLIFAVTVDRKDSDSLKKWVFWGTKKHGQGLGYPRSYENSLSQGEADDIRFIVTTLADKSIPTILKNKGAIEAAGDRIDHVHPLRFLMCVFTNEELKVGIRNLRAKGLLWGEFVAGLKDSLATESNNQNITNAQIAHFASTVGIDINIIYTPIQERRWDNFIDLLIAHIPRKDDGNRYDS